MPDPNSLEGFHRARGRDTSSLTIFLCHTISLHRRGAAGEASPLSGGRASVPHTPAFPILPNSHSPKTCFGHKMPFSPLWALWLMPTNSSKHWWAPVPSRASSEFVSMMPGKWTQDFQLLNCLNKRKIPSDYLHKKSVSINWDNYYSGTEVSPHWQGHQLKRVLIAQDIDTSGYQ